jgi:hypothetical protein
MVVVATGRGAYFDWSPGCADIELRSGSLPLSFSLTVSGFDALRPGYLSLLSRFRRGAAR